MSNPSESLAPLQLDVREIPPRLKHATIFRVWESLPVEGHFVLVNDHDPVPLYYQFSGQYPGAFDWEYLERGPDVFRVRITRLLETKGPAPEPPIKTAARAGAAPAGAAADSGANVREVDARGLEPPEPLMRILNALEELPAGWSLRAITDREPCHLFGEAEQRGFKHETREQADGSWVTVLARG